MRDGTRLWDRVTADVLVLLTALDPYGLEPGSPEGSPADEYEFEAHPIARVLIREGRIDLGQLDEVWLHWFSEPLSARLRPEVAAEFVAQLNLIVGDR